MSIESLVRHLGVVEDPRCQGKIDHRLIDILVIAVCAVIACAESWDDIALYGRSKLAWLPGLTHEIVQVDQPLSKSRFGPETDGRPSAR